MHAVLCLWRDSALTNPHFFYTYSFATVTGRVGEGSPAGYNHYLMKFIKLNALELNRLEYNYLFLLFIIRIITIANRRAHSRELSIGDVFS